MSTWKPMQINYFWDINIQQNRMDPKYTPPIKAEWKPMQINQKWIFSHLLHISTMKYNGSKIYTTYKSISQQNRIQRICTPSIFLLHTETVTNSLYIHCQQPVSQKGFKINKQNCSFCSVYSPSQQVNNPITFNQVSNSITVVLYIPQLRSDPRFTNIYVHNFFFFLISAYMFTKLQTTFRFQHSSTKFEQEYHLK